MTDAASKTADVLYEFEIGARIRGGVSGAKWINQPTKDPSDPEFDYELPRGPHPLPSGQLGGVGTGFPTNMSKPVFLLDPTFGRLPLTDGEPLGRYLWLISDRAKRVFERLDAAAFEFRDVEFEGAERLRPRDTYWLCDVVRSIDALDQDRTVNILRSPGIKYAAPTPGYPTFFLRSRLGGLISSVWRTRLGTSTAARIFGPSSRRRA